MKRHPVLLICATAVSVFLIIAGVQAQPQQSTAGARAATQAPYQPSWDSLSKHLVPDWYRDAKFGIYFHWGIYSVPAFGSEWYSRNMYQKGSRENLHHVGKYGPPSTFGYKDFIPMFKAEKFNPDEWAELFEKAGAKFAGPVAEHADGFSLWDSKVNQWNAAQMGPKRDLVGELAKAIRKRRLKFITTLHHQWLWGWYSTTEKDADVYNPRFSSFYGPPLGADAFHFDNPQPKPGLEFCEVWRSKLNEVLAKYQPDLVYFDSRAAIIPEKYRREFLAHYYNQALQWGREVVVTYKNNDFARDSAVVDIEAGRMAKITDYVWQTDDLIDWNSWAYLEKPNYKPVTRLIHELVDIVSKNGVLLLDIGPRPDGTIPEPIVERLLQIGAWLKINGEAIYGTRPFKIFGEGPTEVKEGHFGEAKIKDFTAKDIRFTTKGNTLYAIVLGWPDKQLVIKSLGRSSRFVEGRFKQIEMLGYRDKLKWVQDKHALTIEMPAQKPCEYAFVFKMK